MLFALVLGGFAGTLMPVQTAVNTRLSHRIGAILPASLLSFVVGSAALGLLTLLTGTTLPLAATAAGQPWWVWLGGVCGLVLRTLNIVLMPRIGASATVVLPLVGQVLGGVVIDALGAFGMTLRPLTTLRVLGGLLVITGAALASLRSRTPAAGRFGAHPLLWAVGVLAGSLGAVQIAVNGRLGEAMGSALAAALVSFTVSAIGLGVITFAARQRVQVSGPLPGWIFTGGLFGATFVWANAFLAPLLGTSLAVSVVLLGQLAGGLLLDHFGWLGATRRPVTRRQLLGVGVVLLGVALVRFAT
jgi:transporter family-2 protein